MTVDREGFKNLLKEKGLKMTRQRLVVLEALADCPQQHLTAEEIYAGESDNVEFKEGIPAKSEKYMKTVVAFANGKGGKIMQRI